MAPVSAIKKQPSNLRAQEHIARMIAAQQFKEGKISFQEVLAALLK